jgi:hypothetical protein
MVRTDSRVPVVTFLLLREYAPDNSTWSAQRTDATDRHGPGNGIDLRLGHRGCEGAPSPSRLGRLLARQAAGEAVRSSDSTEL